MQAAGRAEVIFYGRIQRSWAAFEPVFPSPSGASKWSGVQIAIPVRGVRRDVAARRLVGAAGRRRRRSRGLHRLHDVGRVAGRALRLRQLPVAPVLAGAVRRLVAQRVRAAARVVAGVAPVLARDPHSVGAGGLPGHLLLLSGRRTTRRSGPTRRRARVGEPRNAFRGENSFPLILQNIHRYFLYLAIGFVVVLSYDAWAALWFEDAAGRRLLRHRRRVAGPRPQRRADRRLHLQLSLAAAPSSAAAATASRTVPCRSGRTTA